MMQFVFDIPCALIVLVCIIVSYYRGFLKEIINFLGLTLTFFLTVTQYDFFEQMALERVHSKVIAMCISAIAVFFTVYLTVSLFSQFIKSIIPNEVNYFKANRILGALVGVLKGVAVCYIIFFVMSFYYAAQYQTVEHNNQDSSIETMEKENTDEFPITQSMLPQWFEASYSYKFLSELNDEVYYNFPKSFKSSVMDAFQRLDAFLEEEIKNDKGTGKSGKENVKE